MYQRIAIDVRDKRMVASLDEVVNQLEIAISYCVHEGRPIVRRQESVHELRIRVEKLHNFFGFVPFDPAEYLVNVTFLSDLVSLCFNIHLYYG